MEWDGVEAGCDEAGRGCLAGPVTAAAVCLPRAFPGMELVNDSKRLSPKERARVRGILEREAIAFKVVHVAPRVIDAINILQASILAMQMAVDALPLRPDLLLVDGNRFSEYTRCPYRCVVRGDARYLSVAAASILAKTYRDELMDQLSMGFPHYGWARNKGYPTAEHMKAIDAIGPCVWHRTSFRGVKP